LCCIACLTGNPCWSRSESSCQQPTRGLRTHTRNSRQQSSTRLPSLVFSIFGDLPPKNTRTFLFIHWCATPFSRSSGQGRSFVQSAVRRCDRNTRNTKQVRKLASASSPCPFTVSGGRAASHHPATVASPLPSSFGNVARYAPSFVHGEDVSCIGIGFCLARKRKREIGRQHQPL
jgi:hypothetical protein